MCDVITDDGNCLTYTTNELSFDQQQSFCYNWYGSNLVMIDSSQLFTDVGDFCSKHINDGRCWIGIQMISCNNSNYTLQYVNGTSLSDDSFIDSTWCAGYPNISLCNAFNQSFIYFDATNSSSYCLKHNATMKLNGICGNPVHCLESNGITDEIQRGYFYSLTTTAFIGCVFTSIALWKFHQHLFKKHYTYVDDRVPSRAVTYTAICFPTLQLIQYLAWLIGGLFRIGFCTTDAIPSTDWGYNFKHYPRFEASYTIIESLGLLCSVLSNFTMYPLHMSLR